MCNILNYICDGFNFAFDKLYKNDRDLISSSASERAIVYRFAYYLNIYLEPIFEQYNKYHPSTPITLDVEYNRFKYDFTKGINNKLIVPDLIIHSRKHNNNLLVCEFKGWWYKEDEDICKDINRLKYMTTNCEKYNYQLGIFIKLCEDPNDTKKNVKVFRNGREIYYR